MALWALHFFGNARPTQPYPYCSRSTAFARAVPISLSFKLGARRCVLPVLLRCAASVLPVLLCAACFTAALITALLFFIEQKRALKEAEALIRLQ
jgi:hypothetical protein